MRETLADYCVRMERQDLLTQWDADGSGDLTPESVSYGSRRKVWWRCEKGPPVEAPSIPGRGASPAAPTAPERSPGRGSATWPPLSGGGPGVAPHQNSSLTPDQVLWGSSRRVWWQCPHGHEWSAW